MPWLEETPPRLRMEFVVAYRSEEYNFTALRALAVLGHTELDTTVEARVHFGEIATLYVHGRSISEHEQKCIRVCALRFHPRGDRAVYRILEPGVISSRCFSVKRAVQRSDWSHDPWVILINVSRVRDGAEAPSFAFIGRNIRALRRQKKWTQSELGRKLSSRKLSRQAIGWIEAGKNTDLETIADIAATLGVGIDALTSRTATHEIPATPKETAAELVSALLARPAPSWSKMASRDERYRSPDVVRALLDKADPEFENDPIRCRAICAVAAHLAETLARPGDHDIAELRVKAWKDLAHVTARLGKCGDALLHLERADGAALMSADPEHQKAIVEFERSIVFLHAEQFLESREHLLAARFVLQKCDGRRYFMTFQQEAILDSFTGDARAAAERLEQLISDAQSRGQHEDQLPGLHITAAFAWYRAGEPARAAESLRKSAAMHNREGSASEKVWDLIREATVLAALGKTAASFSKYDEARTKLIALGLHNDLIELDFYYLAAKTEAGADAAELHEIASRLANAAVAARLPLTACEAIASLQRAAERLTPDFVAAVQGFVRGSQLRPETPSDPPKT